VWLPNVRPDCKRKYKNVSEGTSKLHVMSLNAADLLSRLRKAVHLIQQCLDKSGIVEQEAWENLRVTSDFIKNMKNI
jgi:hypothetical protein